MALLSGPVLLPPDQTPTAPTVQPPKPKGPSQYNLWRRLVHANGMNAWQSTAYPVPTQPTPNVNQGYQPGPGGFYPL